MPARPVLAAWILCLGACGGAEPPRAGPGTEPVLPLSPSWRGELSPELVALIEKHVERVRADPAQAEPHGTLGLVYQASRMWPEARLAFERAHALAPEEPLWLDHLADALGELGRDGQAWELLERGGARFPEHPPTLQRLGLARLEQGRFEEARALFARVAAGAPGSPAGHLGLGAAALELGDPEGARAALETALERDPGERSGHYLLGRALRALGREDEALGHLRKGSGGRLKVMSDEADPRLERFAVGPEHRRQRATRALAGGRPEEAAQILAALRAEQPGDARVAIDLGVAYARLGRTEAALEAFRAAGALDPDAHLVHANAAACLLDLGRAEQALEAAERAVVLAPELAQGHLMRGRALAALGRSAEARASLAQAGELAPGDRQVQRALAELAETPR